MHHLGSNFCKSPVCQRLGSNEIHDSRQVLMIDNKLNGMQNIFYMYPGEPLFSGSNLSADKETERQQHLRQRASVFCQDNPETCNNQPDISRQLLRLIFPTDTDISQETRSFRRTALRINTLIRINTDGRSRDEHFRLHLHPIDDRNQSPGRMDTAVQYFTLGFPGPALVDSSSRQVDYDIASGQCLPQFLIRPRTEHRMFQRDNNISSGR